MISFYNFILGILAPLIFGYAIPLKKTFWQAKIHRALLLTIPGLLITMGALFAQDESLKTNLLALGFLGSFAFVVMTLLNFAGLWVVTQLQLFQQPETQTLLEANSLVQRLLKAIKECSILFYLVAGYLIGHSGIVEESIYQSLSQAILFILLLLIGFDLRLHNIHLGKALLNQKGFIIAMILCLSSLLAAVVIAFTTDLDWRQTVAITSGYGWYSLTGILVTQKFGSMTGSLAFALDLCRELLIIVCLPIFTRMKSGIAVGYCGATAVDVTLPFLKKAYGPEVIPLALSSGLILSILTPLILFLI